MPRVALHTLGCKVNQYETGKISDAFTAKGFKLVKFTESADVYVINTCTVTLTADSKSRQAVRSAINRNPDAVVVMTGCYAETSPEAAESLDGVSLVVGNQDKSLIVDKVVDLLPEDVVNSLVTSDDVGSSMNGRTRALLKVQDGCDQFCTYCAVPLARSIMWSRPAVEVLDEAHNLAELGYKEIVLTGIRIGRYLDGDLDLTGLIEKLAEIKGIERIRISSIESTDVPEDFLELMARNRKVCRHLHVPLQSGDNAVLARMNRPYTSAQFMEFIENARKLVPGIAVTTDIMVGFPGETPEEFDNTCRFAEKVAFSRAHIFRYSPRPGTVAADCPDIVAESVKEERSSKLIKLTAGSARKFAENLIGNRVPVLIESKKTGKNCRSGLTDTYVRVHVEAGAEHVGQIVYIQVDGISGNEVYGTIVPPNT